MKRIALASLIVAAVAVPTAPAAEPASPKNAAQWCKAWRAGSSAMLPRMSALFGAGSYTALFATSSANGTEKKNLFGRCVSLTAKKLAASKGTAVGATTAPAATAGKAACSADRSSAQPKYRNLGACISDGGAKLVAPG